MEPNQRSRLFEWVQAEGGAALRCASFERYARHLFGSRAWPLGSPGAEPAHAWSAVARAIDVRAARLCRANQVHGASVQVWARGAGLAAQPLPAADVLTTDDPTLALAVQTADCVPLLVVDRRTGAIAAAHAGWRGLTLDVPGVTVRAMGVHWGSRPDDLMAVAGPAIGPCCYEVGGDVRQRFVAAGVGEAQLEGWFHTRSTPSADNPTLPTLPAEPRPGHWFFDAQAATRDQLEAAGVPPAQIAIAPFCTASHPSLFCSFRRDGAGAGRLAAVVRMAS